MRLCEWINPSMTLMRLTLFSLAKLAKVVGGSERVNSDSAIILTILTVMPFDRYVLVLHDGYNGRRGVVEGNLTLTLNTNMPKVGQRRGFGSNRTAVSPI